MATPLVSILVPCFNAAPWLTEALESALAQTWPSVEIIVVDDGSTDESFRIAREFESGRCRILRQEHTGASAARNRAFTAAQGDYIQYLDADDLLASDKLERQMRVIVDLGPEALSHGPVVHFSDLNSSTEREKHLPSAPVAGMDPGDFLTELWMGQGPTDMVQTGQWLTPRRLLQKAGLWDESLSLDDDGEFFSRVIFAAERIVPVPDALCYYRKFQGGRNLSTTGSRESAMQAAKLKCARLLERSGNERARGAVRRLVTREIIDSYPSFPGVVNDGLKFLEDHQLKLAETLEGSPWFRRLHPLIGWRAARWLQCCGRSLKKARPNARVADSLRSAHSRAAENRHPGDRPGVGRCSLRRAIARPRA